LKSLDGERALVALGNALFCDIVGGIEVGRFDIETDAIGPAFSAEKFPYSIGMKDNSPFVFAGLWEGWKDPASDEWRHTCTIITGEPNEFVREIHTRMPVILPEEHHDSWLFGKAGKEINPLPGGPNEGVAS
jgi:hypothetical protein